MKKALCLIFLVLSCVVSNAQRIGVEAGYSHSFAMSGVYSKEAIMVRFSPTNMNGAFLGLNIEVPGNKLFSLMIDPVFSWERGNSSASDYRYWSVGIPTNFQFNFKIAKNWSGFIFAGIYGEYYSYSLDRFLSTSVDYSANFLQLGADAGLGVEIIKHIKVFGKFARPVIEGKISKGINSQIDFKRITLGVAYMF